jgi:hypothetical protein
MSIFVKLPAPKEGGDYSADQRECWGVLEDWAFENCKEPFRMAVTTKNRFMTDYEISAEFRSAGDARLFKLRWS